MARLHAISFQFERLILRIQKTVLRREGLRYRSDETTYFLSLDTQSRYMTRDREAIASVSFSGFKHIILHVIDPCRIRC